MATLELTMPTNTDFMQDDLPSPATHHTKCFGCAFSRPTSLQYHVLVDEEYSNNDVRSSPSSEKENKVGNNVIKCLPAASGRWRSLVNSASMKKRNGAIIATNKPDFSYDLRSYNLNFDEGEEDY